MKILYLHGLGSSGNSNTYKVLRDLMPQHEVYSIDIPDDPEQALRYINDVCYDGEFNMVVGTSLGGFYAMNIPGLLKVVVNPCMHPSTELHNITEIGVTHKRFSPQRNSDMYIVTEEYLESFNRIEYSLYNSLDEEMTYETYALFGTKDDVVSDYDEFCSKYRKNRIYKADFGHRLTEDIIVSNLIEIINKADESHSEVFVL